MDQIDFLGGGKKDKKEKVEDDSEDEDEKGKEKKGEEEESEKNGQKGKQDKTMATMEFAPYNQFIWSLITEFFNANPQSWVNHHIQSYEYFIDEFIPQTFRQHNPLIYQEDYDESTKSYKHKCSLYFGGKEGNQIYFGKPILMDQQDKTERYLMPNEARLRNMTYAMSIHYDVTIEYEDTEGDFPDPTLYCGEGVDTGKNSEKDSGKNSGKDTGKAYRSHTLKHIYLGKIPIMLNSRFCLLRHMTPEMRMQWGECKNDHGGYFIVDGSEKCIVSQEKFADNMLYIRKYDTEATTSLEVEEEDDTEASGTVPEYICSADIRSVSENISKPKRTLSVRIKHPKKSYSFHNIVVNIPNVRAPVPLFIVFRALGVLSDKDIIETCLLDMKKYEFMQDLFIPSVHDASLIHNQMEALDFIALLLKHKNRAQVMLVLSDYFLPHVGELNFVEKAKFLGNMVFRLLLVHTGMEVPTDRDNYKYKRLEPSGILLSELFQEHYQAELQRIRLVIHTQHEYHKAMYKDVAQLICSNQREIFEPKVLDKGLRKAFKGDWGLNPHSKRIGVVQSLDRLSYNSTISHLRKLNLDIGDALKMVEPRVLTGSQWGFLDPLDSPDGANIGLHKSLATMTHISQPFSRKPVEQWLEEECRDYLLLLKHASNRQLAARTKLFVNGNWLGSVDDPWKVIYKFKTHRRLGLLPFFLSISFEIPQNTIYVYTDAGRMCRPIFYTDEHTGQYSFMRAFKASQTSPTSWQEYVIGKNTTMVPYSSNRLYDSDTLYQTTSKEGFLQLMQKQGVLDYIDPSETVNALICLNIFNRDARKHYTHVEIHESLLFGAMASQILCIENNAFPRNAFSCVQSKQACSLYHSNYPFRMDKTALVLNYGQVPLVKSRYMHFLNREEHPYGVNAMVAVMSYTGYNVEDSILINASALERGLFRTTYYTTYEEREQKSQVGGEAQEEQGTGGQGTGGQGGDMEQILQVFANPLNESKIRRLKTECDYSHLDDKGIIREGTVLHDKIILLGMVSRRRLGDEEKVEDCSVGVKKGQKGVVDKVFINDGPEGTRTIKIRVREWRVPDLGDKMAGRAGQKGTLGLILKEEDMPFTKQGIRPDLIINPHALPSRMTIGQLVEVIMGKIGVLTGTFADCTAFNVRGPQRIPMYMQHLNEASKELKRNGFHSSGNEILYNGMSGEQIEAEIFFGPMYYMRLKHMVKDKVNYRGARGPNSQITRQPVGGRANDGGLRIGEMERDSLISHGMANFLKESMMERADKFYVAICNQTGTLAIHNPELNVWMSPMADGPLTFLDSLNLDAKRMQAKHVTKFGRNFSYVEVPYSFKLFLQEMMTAQIHMKIITEDNYSFLEEWHKARNPEFEGSMSNVRGGGGKKNKKQKVKTIYQEPLKPEEFDWGIHQDKLQDYEEKQSEERLQLEDRQQEQQVEENKALDLNMKLDPPFVHPFQKGHRVLYHVYPGTMWEVEECGKASIVLKFVPQDEFQRDPTNGVCPMVSNLELLSFPSQPITYPSDQRVSFFPELKNPLHNNNHLLAYTGDMSAMGLAQMAPGQMGPMVPGQMGPAPLVVVNNNSPGTVPTPVGQNAMMPTMMPTMPAMATVPCVENQVVPNNVTINKTGA